MTIQDFERCLLQNLHRQPFLPFAVELTDGRRIIVKQLPVVYADGGAGFIDPDDGALVDFVHDEVSSFALLEQGKIMTKDEFETKLREYVHRQPFRPFVVRLTDGRRIAIKKPPVVFADGAASFIDLEERELV